MSRIVKALSVVLGISALCCGSEIYLSDMDISKIRTGWASPKKDLCATNRPLAIAGKKFEKGVGLHAVSVAYIDLKRDATRFSSYVGVDDSVMERTGAIGSVHYQVIGDDKPLYESEVLRSGQLDKVDIDVTGIRYLTLLMGDGYDGISHDHADWADCKIVYNSKKPELFTLKDRPNLKGKLPGQIVFYPKDAPEHVKAIFNRNIVPKLNRLPQQRKDIVRQVDHDWLLEDTNQNTSVYRIENSNDIVLSNGLISRTFRLYPNACTIGIDNHTSGEAVLRAIRPEATIKLDGKEYNVGGLISKDNQSYIKDEFLDRLGYDPSSLSLIDMRVAGAKERFSWKRVRHHADQPWPAPGLELVFDYAVPDEAYKGLVLSVHYDMYDNVPIMSKWFTVHNGTSRDVTVNEFESEIIAVMDQSQLYCETDYDFGGGIKWYKSRKAVHWTIDPDRSTERLREICLFKLHPEIGPNYAIEPNGRFETFRGFEIFLDSTEPVRKNLSICQFYRTVAPWVTENPIMMHVRNADEDTVKNAIDQCAEVGFEMVILSFGSGFNHENTNPDYLKHWRRITDYARAKNIDIGAYSLLASRSINPQTDVISVKTNKPGDAVFGSAPCLGSTWGIEYLEKLKMVMRETGFKVFEHDGSYAGDTCASKDHPNHKGYLDSRWTQWKQITDLYKWCRANGIYLNVPDSYFMAGSTKIMMPYKEGNWALPREEQVLLARDHIYDGTSHHSPTMGWMLTPLVGYGGGDEASTLEPLSEHLDFYSYHLGLNFACGVQSCYRGSRLYDTDETKAVVEKWVDFYKKYRAILDSDIVHIRRPDGRNIDGMIHVNPRLEDKGLAVLFNPLAERVTTKVKLPLYYTGLTEKAMISERGNEFQAYELARDYSVEVEVEFEPRSMQWLVIR